MGIERSIRTMHFILAVLLAAATAAPELDPGLGTLHWTVSTKNAMAQKYFDQGMKYVYAFNHEQAVRSFEEATRRDPELAMGYWGAALALGPNINLDVDPEREKKAYDAIHAAAQRLGHASAKERDLVAALTKRYTNDPQGDLKKLAADYSQAMGELAKKYPNDDDVAVLYAESVMDLRPWKFWSHDGKPAPGTEEGIATLQRVLKRNPNHHFVPHLRIEMYAVGVEQLRIEMYAVGVEQLRRRSVIAFRFDALHFREQPAGAFSESLCIHHHEICLAVARTLLDRFRVRHQPADDHLPVAHVVFRDRRALTYTPQLHECVARVAFVLRAHHVLLIGGGDDSQVDELRIGQAGQADEIGAPFLECGDRLLERLG